MVISHVHWRWVFSRIYWAEQGSIGADSEQSTTSTTARTQIHGFGSPLLFLDMRLLYHALFPGLRTGSGT